MNPQIRWLGTFQPKPRNWLAPTHVSLLFRLACFLTLALGVAYPLAAATLTVTNLNGGGPGTLRQAIADASPGDTINFGVTGNIVLTNELVIGTNLIINGPGATNLIVSVSLDTNVYSRIFRVTGGTNIVSGLTLAYGYPNIFEKGGAISNAGGLIVRDCLLAYNVAPGADGGGIFNSGTLTISNCTFTGNIGVSGGGIKNEGVATITMSTFSANTTDADGDGGAIENQVTMSVNDSSFSGNVTRHGDGGAIMNGGILIVANCVFLNNQSPDSFNGGGAIANRAGNCIVTESRLSANYAITGGGIGNAGSFVLKRSTVNGTSSFHSGMGIVNYGSFTGIESTISDNYGPDDGGGFFVYSGNVFLTNCTLSGNKVSPGGGIRNEGGNVILDSCTVTRNGSFHQGPGLLNYGTMTVRNSIVADNISISSPPFSDVAGAFISGGYNLIGFGDDSTGFTNGVNHDQVGTSASALDPKLGPLQDNGGSTFTHALRFDSPAIDQGNSGGLTTDQRGLPRPIDDPATTNASGGDGSDIGAYEADPNLRITAIEKVGADIRLKFNSVFGKNYRMNREDNLDNSWSVLSNNIPGTGGTIELLDLDAASQPRRFYRAEKLP